MLSVHICYQYTYVISTHVISTHMLSVHICYQYTHVISTHMLSVHICYQYTYVINTHMLSIHICYQYTCVISTHMLSVHICYQYTYVISTHMLSVHICTLRYPVYDMYGLLHVSTQRCHPQGGIITKARCQYMICGHAHSLRYTRVVHKCLVCTVMCTCHIT